MYLCQLLWHRPKYLLIVLISNQSQFLPIVRNLPNQLHALGISDNTDSPNASIGKRYDVAS
ncbi:hypothetical protein K449DRAFT_385187 [Hypoxylon sp. EC38]|nr:hypothetical protein K449DRAFT_385187 [Hypoxylon sp. EC38]